MAATDNSQIDHDVCHDCNQSQTLEQIVSESGLLLYHGVSPYRFSSKLKSRLKRIVCLRSKPATLLLIWTFLISALHWSYDQYSLIITIGSVSSLDFLSAIVGVYTIFAIFQLVYPVAGLLADIRYGRYKCVIGSVWTFVIGCCFLPVLSGIMVVVLMRYLLFSVSRPWSYAMLAGALIMIRVPTVIGIVLFFLVLLHSMPMLSNSVLISSKTRPPNI